MANYAAYLDALFNSGHDLADWRHAAYLYREDNFKLGPKQKFLYHVSLEPTFSAREYLPYEQREEINMLIKSVDLPKFQIQSETLNQYNRKKNVQTGIEYQPVSITFHDDNFGLTTALMESYYRYYFRDGYYTSDNNVNNSGQSHHPRSSYRNSNFSKFKYGFDNGSVQPFFNQITIFQLARGNWTGFTLVNPLITDFGHDSLDNSDSSTVENRMTISYEAVRYTRNSVAASPPPGFANSHYHKSIPPSNLSVPTPVLRPAINEASPVGDTTSENIIPDGTPGTVPFVDPDGRATIPTLNESLSGMPQHVRSFANRAGASANVINALGSLTSGNIRNVGDVANVLSGLGFQGPVGAFGQGTRILSLVNRISRSNFRDSNALISLLGVIDSNANNPINNIVFPRTLSRNVPVQAIGGISSIADSQYDSKIQQAMQFNDPDALNRVVVTDISPPEDDNT